MVAEDLVVQDAVARRDSTTMQERSQKAELAPRRFVEWGWTGLETLTAVGVALLFTLWAGNVDVNPMDRVGQVSGLAALQFRFAVVAAVLVVMLVLAHRFLTPDRRDVAVRLGCAAVPWVHLRGLLVSAGGMSDAYFYFDTATEPTYFAMWRNDLPGDVGTVWPPLGELGHVSLFPLLLALGLGVALWLGWRRTVVIAVGCFAASAWFMRMWLASEAYATQTVQLYPRTTMILLYCMLILTGFAVFYAVEALRRFARRATTANSTGVANRPTKAVATVPVGLLLIPLLFVLASAGSATVDHYMPELKLRGSYGYFARIAHVQRLPNGQCPKYGRGKGCKPRPTQPGGGGPRAGNSSEADPGP